MEKIITENKNVNEKEYITLQPEVDVCLSVNEPLFSESMLNDTNLMSVTLESLFSPPEGWPLSSQHVYTGVIPVPISHEVCELGDPEVRNFTICMVFAFLWILPLYCSYLKAY